jgi:HEAT repeat protein
MRVAIAFLCVGILAAVAAECFSAPPALSPDEQTLKAAGLGRDGLALIEFFTQRMRAKVDQGELFALAQTLGDNRPDVQAKAMGQLISWGPAALPALRRVVNDLDNPRAAEKAQECLKWIDGSRRTDVTNAATRLLAARQTPGASKVLLAYLPYAEDTGVLEAIKQSLKDLASGKSKQDADLLSALQDPLPLRRAIAVEVLSSAGKRENLPAVRGLMNDPNPQVRVRAAVALAEKHDEVAIGVLIDLLAELPLAQRQLAEYTLQELAGEWAPNPVLKGGDEVSGKIRRDAWAAWWKATDGPSLLTAFRKRTLGPDETASVVATIDKLADKNFAVRERAMLDLVGMGPKVVPLLREAAKSTDTERAQRAQLGLSQIAREEDKHRLPAAAARLLVLRKPPGAIEALLAFLPFTDDELMRHEIAGGIKNLATGAGKPDAAIVKALEDPLAIRRSVAAEVLASLGEPEYLAAVRALLNDKDTRVRLRAALALASAQDKNAVPVLIELAAELPPGQAYEAEDLLYRLAGEKGPKTRPVDTAAGRKAFREEWASWWKKNEASISLAASDASVAMIGYTIVAEVGGGGVGGGNGRIVELDRAGKPRWTIDDVNFPVDVHYLRGDHVLVTEWLGNRVTERDLKGKIVWQYISTVGSLTNAQRMQNGNTFVTASAGSLMELDRAGKVVFKFKLTEGLNSGCKLPNGQIVCLTQQGTCIRLDASGKEVKRFKLELPQQWTSRIEMTPRGNLVVARGIDEIAEYNPDGEIVWRAKASQNTSASRLANGHTLVASHSNASVVELDRTGRVVWEYKSPAGFNPFRARKR